MLLQRTGRGAGRLSISCVLVVFTVLLSSCSLRDKAAYGIVNVGPLPPPDGAQLAEGFERDLADARRALNLPPPPREGALDDLARKALGLLEAGLPEGATAIGHLQSSAALPDELEYAVGFEEDAPGLSDLLREQGRRRGGATISTSLMAADPGFVGLGWATSGPWAVFVLRARTLVPADGPALLAALEGELREQRPTLTMSPDLARIASDALADNLVTRDDIHHFARAGGVPVKLVWEETKPARLTSYLHNTLLDEGPETLREAWLKTVGVAVKVTEAGKTLVAVLATGDVDRAVLTAELAAAEAKAPELVNKARAEAALPAVSLDPALVALAKQWVSESSRRGCFLWYQDHPVCPDPFPRKAESIFGAHSMWSTPEDAFTWYLAPARTGHEELKRFGVAASIAQDGTVWSVVIFGR